MRNTLVRCAARPFCACRPSSSRSRRQADAVSARAKQLHERAIVIDSHDDTTQRLLSDKTFDIGKRQKNGNVDIPRMREGGLDGLFFSIWVPSDVTGVKAVNTANALIASVHKAVAAHPERPDARDHRRRRPPRRVGAQDRRADGDGGRPHDQRRSGAAAEVRRARRPLPDADAFQEQQLGRLVHRQAGAQRPDAVRQGRRPRAEQARDDGGHLARRRQDVLRRAGADQGAGDRVAFVVPRDRQPPAQHDRRHAARAGEERRRRDDQLPRRASSARSSASRARRRAARSTWRWRRCRRNAAATRPARRWRASGSITRR